MPTLDLSQRNTLSELMDSDETDFETFRACLVDLARVNQLTFAYRPTLRFFEHLANSGCLPRDRAITVIDVGSGFGDMLRVIDSWAVQSGFRVDLTGVDLNPSSAYAAERATSPGRPIRFITANVFDYQPPCRIDVVISSLFAHHLEDASLVRFISWMDANVAIG